MKKLSFILAVFLYVTPAFASLQGVFSCYTADEVPNAVKDISLEISAVDPSYFPELVQTITLKELNLHLPATGDGGSYLSYQGLRNNITIKDGTNAFGEEAVSLAIEDPTPTPAFHYGCQRVVTQQNK